jgi:hypothetical protein
MVLADPDLWHGTAATLLDHFSTQFRTGIDSNIRIFDAFAIQQKTCLRTERAESGGIHSD